MSAKSIQRRSGIWILALAAVTWCFLDCSCSPDQPGASSDAGGYEQPAPQPDKKSESRGHKRKRRQDRRSDGKLPPGVPDKVAWVLKYIDEHKKAPKDYVGGRTFQNREGQLAKRDRAGKPIRYQEWDVNRKIRGRNRGPQRLVTGSDGSAYYTPDHYKSFKKIR